MLPLNMLQRQLAKAYEVRGSMWLTILYSYCLMYKTSYIYSLCNEQYCQEIPNAIKTVCFSNTVPLRVIESDLVTFGGWYSDRNAINNSSHSKINQPTKKYVARRSQCEITCRNEE